MRRTLAQRYRQAAMMNPGSCFDDVLTLMGLHHDPERNAVRPRLYQMHEHTEHGGLRDLLEQGTVVPTLGTRARCFREFMAQAKEPVIPRVTNYPAIDQIKTIVEDGFVKDTGKAEAVLRELKDSNLSSKTLERTEQTVVDRIRRESDAHNRAEGWREAALAYKRLANRDPDAVVRLLDTKKVREG